MRRAKVSLEAERRFILSAIPHEASKLGTIYQGYLFIFGPFEMRVRSGIENSLAIKFAQGYGRRMEFEMEIARYLAEFLLAFTPWRLFKTRSTKHYNGQRWDIDVYHGTLEGLITAEAETENFDTLAIPEWVGIEVTGSPEWSNRSLSRFGLLW